MATNNRAVKALDLHGSSFLKYGRESSEAIKKFIGIMMDNYYKKLQYLSKFSPEALKNTLETPWKEVNESIVGEQLEALQDASMNYVMAKGVGRQSSKLGKDRMELGLDLAATSSKFMNKYASAERIKEVEAFENDVTDQKITKDTICDGFTNSNIDKKDSNIFEDTARSKNDAHAAELSDDDEDELDDEL
ncbi:MAG: hypothetical protein IKU47_03975 [Oscillospiraceae bacterium]|nr:hypothetical protein [Oscillospiraceae bacterium]